MSSGCSPFPSPSSDGEETARRREYERIKGTKWESVSLTILYLQGLSPTTPLISLFLIPRLQSKRRYDLDKKYLIAQVISSMSERYNAEEMPHQLEVEVFNAASSLYRTLNTHRSICSWTFFGDKKWLCRETRSLQTAHRTVIDEDKRRATELSFS